MCVGEQRCISRVSLALCMRSEVCMTRLQKPRASHVRVMGIWGGQVTSGVTASRLSLLVTCEGCGCQERWCQVCVWEVSRWCVCCLLPERHPFGSSSVTSNCPTAHTNGTEAVRMAVSPYGGAGSSVVVIQAATQYITSSTPTRGHKPYIHGLRTSIPCLS